jgi:hypothetical protein
VTHTSDTRDFYRDLSPLASFAEAMEARRHVDVPDDWWVVIADVEGSTDAIQSGAYKKVNTVGVACIAAVFNLDRSIELPFLFGGDGATFAIPECLRERAMCALRGAQRLARESFGLHLRVGLVAVGELAAAGYWVRLAKVRLSAQTTQPALSGRGWQEAERRVKQPGMPGALPVIEGEGAAEASFEGFECRWQGVPSVFDHKLAILVAATATDAETNLDTYKQLLDRIETINGDVALHHPLRADRMRLALSPALLGHEWRVRAARLGWPARVGYFFRMLLQNLAGSYLFARRQDTAEVAWSRYRDALVENSDIRKFDCMLRMIVDGTEAQCQALEAYLEEGYRGGRLAYGLHKSRAALVTCIVQSHRDKHIHFVDGSDGGYTLAARDLKQRLAALRAGAG